MFSVLDLFNESLFVHALVIGAGAFVVWSLSDNVNKGLRWRQGAWVLGVYILINCLGYLPLLLLKENIEVKDVPALSATFILFFPLLITKGIATFYNFRASVIEEVSFLDDAPELQIKHRKFLSLFKRFYYLTYEPIEISYLGDKNFDAVTFILAFDKKTVDDMYQLIIRQDKIKTTYLKRQQKIYYQTYLKEEINNILNLGSEMLRQELLQLEISNENSEKILNRIKNGFENSFNQRYGMKTVISHFIFKRIPHDYYKRIDIRENKGEDKQDSTEVKLQTI